MNLKDFLQSIGLGKNESEVYTALLDLKNATVLEISKKTSLHRSNIYDAIRGLLKIGLVFEIDEGATKKFSARSPESLIDYLKQKEKEVEEIVEDYQSRVGRDNNEYHIKTTYGIFALKQALFSLLEIGEEIDVYGIPMDAPEIIGPILKNFHKERIKKKVQMNLILNSGAGERVSYLNKLNYTEARILPKKFDSFATTNICGNKIIIFLWQKEVVVIEINSENMARPYKNYFEILWGKAKKPDS